MAACAKHLLCLVALVAVLLAATANGLHVTPKERQTLLHRDFVAEVNAKAKGQWTASAENGHLITGMAFGAVRKLMGVRSLSNAALPPRVFTAAELAQDVPDTFDSATNWPKCPTISEIRDQSSCGSCWAIAAAEAISDRYCTISGIPDRRISTADLMSCCFTCGMGCDGGEPSAAWSWWTWIGLATETCEPYPFPPCAHHSNSSKYPACPSTIYDTPTCNLTCTDSSTTMIKYKGEKSYSLSGEDSYKRELMANGPFEVALEVYADFVGYKSGVYSHVTGDYLGGHAVRLVGWGVLDGTPYWKIANSWNADWGDNGYILIKRGGDECGLESSGVAGTPAAQ